MSVGVVRSDPEQVDVTSTWEFRLIVVWQFSFSETECHSVQKLEIYQGDPRVVHQLIQ